MSLGHLFEANTYPTHRPPNYMARSLGAARFHNQGKSIGDANRVFYFERSPCIRQVAHQAINSGLIINSDRSGLQRPAALHSSFIHGNAR
jgi:hypothetical protein